MLRCTIAQDAGKAIHPSYVEGPDAGRHSQGIGWALNEEYIYDEKGVMRNAGFLDYRMPTCLDLPLIETKIVEVPGSRPSAGNSRRRRGFDRTAAGGGGQCNVSRDRRADDRTADVAAAPAQGLPDQAANRNGYARSGASPPIESST